MPSNRKTNSSIGIFVAAAILVVYLGVGDGGFDLLVWGEVGVIAWWALLLAALVGLVRLRDLDRTAWIPLAALAGLGVWAALGLIWAGSAEHGVTQLARLVTYLGIFALALFAARAGHARALVGGVAAALAVVGVLALLSRLHPAWFPVEAGADLLSERNRLEYPINYFNGLAALLALGITLLAGHAVTARVLAARGLAAAAMPALGLALFFTLSRGGVVALAVGLVALLAVAPRRLPKVAGLLVVGAGTAILIAAAGGRDELRAGARDAVAQDQGNGLLLLTVVVCGAVGLLAPFVAARVERLADGWRPAPRRVGWLTAGVVVAAAVLFLGVGGANAVSDGWREFRHTDIEARTNQQTARLASVSGRGRYQFWRSALDAAGDSPLHGIGTGGFEYWWAQHGRLPRFVRNAHSLYLETFAELGLVGLVLVLVFVGSLLVGGVIRSRRPGYRPVLAVCVAGCASFAASAGFEWIWQIPVLPAAFLIVAAAAAGARLPAEAMAESNGPGWPPRLAVALLSVAALVAVVPPLLGASALRSSQQAVAAGRLGDALTDARTAERAQPYAGSPKLQRALVHERRGAFDPAAAAAREATGADPLNWRCWVIRSRIEARRGRPKLALAAYREARRLNPRSILFSAQRR